LANEYRTLFDYSAHGINPPLAIAAENLEFEAEFDIVHMSNALDHTQDPHRAFTALFTAVKPGGYLIIQGFENEGAFEKYQGMHQWNISIGKEHDLLIKNKDGNGPEYGGNVVLAKSLILDTGKEWFIWICKK
jgi:SAM-dependent methyltransferase